MLTFFILLKPTIFWTGFAMFYVYHSQSIIAGAFAKNDYKLVKKAAIRVLQVSSINDMWFTFALNQWMTWRHTWKQDFIAKVGQFSNLLQSNLASYLRSTFCKDILIKRRVRLTLLKLVMPLSLLFVVIGLVRGTFPGPDPALTYYNLIQSVLFWSFY